MCHSTTLTAKKYVLNILFGHSFSTNHQEVSGNLPNLHSASNLRAPKSDQSPSVFLQSVFSHHISSCNAIRSDLEPVHLSKQNLQCHQISLQCHQIRLKCHQNRFRESVAAKTDAVIKSKHTRYISGCQNRCCNQRRQVVFS
jgi:hypothetical protein